MDSPLLPTIRGGPRDLDDSFADMSLASARSPDPPSPSSTSLRPGPGAGAGSGPTSYQRTAPIPGKASIFGRPPPTRIIDDTPEPPRYMAPTSMGSTGSSAGTGASASGYGNGNGNPMDGRQKPRQSIFPPPPLASSLRGSSTRPNDRPESRTPATSGFGSGSGSSRPTFDYGHEDENENDDVDGQGDGDGDITILPSTSVSEDDQDESSTETRKQVKEENGMTAEARMKRDERLKDSLYELRGMNDTFEIFLNALESARGHNQRLALRVKETSTLLDQYTALLGQTEHTQKLLSNPNWTGADDDLRALEAEHAAREAAEHEALRMAEEAARREEEEQERKFAAQEAARAKESARGATTGRGVPPTSSRGGTTRGRGSGIPAPSTRSVSGGRPPTTSRTAPSGLGLAGQYANVKSSGYGPSRKAT